MLSWSIIKVYKKIRIGECYMKKSESMRNQITDQQVEDCVNRYEKEVENLLETASTYFLENPRKRKRVLNLPDTSDEFMIALCCTIKKRKWEFYIEPVWYSRKRVKIMLDSPYKELSADFL